MNAFETLTFAPIDRRLIEPKLMTADEIAWLDAYHARGRRSSDAARRRRHAGLARSRHKAAPCLIRTARRAAGRAGARVSPLRRRASLAAARAADRQHGGRPALAQHPRARDARPDRHARRGRRHGAAHALAVPARHGGLAARARHAVRPLRPPPGDARRPRPHGGGELRGARRHLDHRPDPRAHRCRRSARPSASWSAARSSATSTTATAPPR